MKTATDDGNNDNDDSNDNNADNNSAFDDKICHKNKNTMTAMTMISMKMMSTKNDANNQNDNRDDSINIHCFLCSIFFHVFFHPL